MNQNEATRAHPIADTAVIILFFLIIFGIAVWGVLLPDRARSENENRDLQQFPAFTATRFFEGKWMTEFSKYLSDQIPMRDSIVAAHAAMERALGKQQNGNVIAGKEGYLFEREDHPSLDNLTASLGWAEDFAAYAASLDIPTYIALAGRKIDVEEDYLPALYGTEVQDAFWAQIEARASELSHAGLINLRDVLRDDTSGKQMYYRTDHHWTAFGALAAYRAICAEMGLIVREDSFFTPEKVSNCFFGTTWSYSAMTWTAPDDMYYLRYEGDERITTELGGKLLDGFYAREMLAKKDKYGSFFGGNYGLMKIRGEGEGRGKLMVIKDSFAHSVLPMLAADYDIDVIDLRYFQQSTAAMLEEGGYDAVLFLCSSNLLTDPPAGENGFLPFAMLTVGLPKQ